MTWGVVDTRWVNSLALGDWKEILFKQIEADFRDWWLSLMKLPVNECHWSVLTMAWCRQATSQYLSQRWPRSVSPYGVTRPQWVNCHVHFCFDWIAPDDHIITIFLPFFSSHRTILLPLCTQVSSAVPTLWGKWIIEKSHKVTLQYFV